MATCLFLKGRFDLIKPQVFSRPEDLIETRLETLEAALEWFRLGDLDQTIEYDTP